MWFLVESDQIATFNLPIYQKIVPRFCLANNDLKWIMVCMVSQNRVWPRKGRWFMIDQIIVESPHGSRLHCCHVPFAHKLLLLSNLLLCYLSIYLTHITKLQMYYLDLLTIIYPGHEPILQCRIIEFCVLLVRFVDSKTIIKFLV